MWGGLGTEVRTEAIWKEGAIDRLVLSRLLSQCFSDLMAARRFVQICAPKRFFQERSLYSEVQSSSLFLKWDSLVEKRVRL